MKINLTRGLEVIVDEIDYIKLFKVKWFAHKSAKNLFYAARRDHGKYTYMHRIIVDAKEYELVDHINGNSLDNRRNNLRITSKSANIQNRHTSIYGTSKYLGVYWDKFNNKWRVQIAKENKTYTFGRYFDEVEAAKVYDREAIKLFGAYAKTNFGVDK